MSEYWKSNAKKYCEYCKTWIADNKSSIAIHETGKAHKEKVAEKLKEIRKRNDQKNAEEKKHNKELAAIERAAYAAMEKDIDANPSLRKKYGTIDSKFIETAVDEKSDEKIKKEKKIKKEPKLVKKERPVTPPQTPEQQSRIGKWQSVEESKQLIQKDSEETFDFSNVDLGLPTSSGRTSKFVKKSIDELTYELDKADKEFKFKAMNPGASSYKRKQEELDDNGTRVQELEQIDVKPKGRWKSIDEYAEITEDKPDIPIQTVKVFEHEEIKKELTEVSVESNETQLQEPVSEKIVSLNMSNKKQKTIGFKKRTKTDSNFKERCADD